MLAALIVWIFVNQSITATKTIANVPIHVINIPADKTIIGLLPNGFLRQRVTLSLEGPRNVVQQIEQGDLQVRLDASTAESDEWVAHITKKNLVSLNPSVDLTLQINSVTHPDFVIKLSPLVTEQVPIYVKHPLGMPPEGYEYLSTWPDKLFQTLSGPEEEIQNVKIKGLRLTLDLSKITPEDLANSQSTRRAGHDDEISFIVPEKWKQIPIPFKNNLSMEINDPEAKHLRIDLLKQRLLPIGKEVPITVYYPQKYSDTINPNTYTLAESEEVALRNGIFFFKQPLFVKDVSQLFLDIVRENIEIVLIAAPTSERMVLEWSLEVIDPHEMTDTFVAFLAAEQKTLGVHAADTRTRDESLRKRFRNYMQRLAVYNAEGEPLTLASTIEGNHIIVHSE